MTLEGSGPQNSEKVEPAMPLMVERQLTCHRRL